MCDFHSFHVILKLVLPSFPTPSIKAGMFYIMSASYVGGGKGRSRVQSPDLISLSCLSDEGMGSVGNKTK